MNFGKNLQNLRKSKNLSQEELADQLSVSRQAISKWESGNGYPETEKLIELSKILDCTLDALVNPDSTIVSSQAHSNLKTTYDRLMNRFSLWNSLAIALILLGTAFLLGFSSFGSPYTEYGLTILFAFLVIAVPIFVINGIKVGNFKEKHPKLEQFYNETEIDRYNNRFSALIATGIGIIMLGLVVFLGLEAAHVFETESSLPVAIFMIFISIGAPIFVFAGIRKGKYDITTYNHENSFETKALNNKIGKICGVLMMSMTLIYLCLGFLLELWETAWVVFPIGGILCGIISMILRKDN